MADVNDWPDPEPVDHLKAALDKMPRKEGHLKVIQQMYIAIRGEDSVESALKKDGLLIVPMELLKEAINCMEEEGTDFERLPELRAIINGGES